MCIESESVGIGQQADPILEVTNTVAHYDERTFSFTNTCDCTDNLMGFQVASRCALTEYQNQHRNGDAQGCQSIHSDCSGQGFIEDTEHRNDIEVLRLGHEFYKDSDVIEGPLGVREPHGTIQEVDDVFLPRVVVPYALKTTIDIVDIRSDRKDGTGEGKYEK